MAVGILNALADGAVITAPFVFLYDRQQIRFPGFEPGSQMTSN